MANKGKGKRKPMTEEEKKKKFGEKYDPNFQPKKPDRSNEKTREGIPTHNAWQDYAVSEQIARDVASLPWNVLSGTKQIVYWTGPNPDNPVQQKGLFINGAVGEIAYIPAYYTTGQTSSGLTMASMQLYTYLRHANSGARNYEPADAIMLIMAMKDIYRRYFEARRCFGIAAFFAYDNRALPRMLFKALGVDYQDFIANMANYRYRLNIIAERINNIAIPKYFRVFNRVAYVSSNWFADSSSVRGQFYVMHGIINYSWSGTSSSQGTELIASQETAFAGAIGSFVNKLQSLEASLEAIESDTDANTISGDILHAFQQSEVYRVAPVDDNYRLAPLFDEDILAQIENMDTLTSHMNSVNASQILSGTWFGHSLNVTQTNGLPFWQPWFGNYSGNQGSNVMGVSSPTRMIFNSHKDNPEYTDVLEWSRMHPVFELDYLLNGATTPTNVNVLQVMECGIELPFGLYIADNPDEGSTLIKQVYSPTTNNVSSNEVRALLRLMQYDWHPPVYFLQNPVTAGAESRMDVGMDVKKFTLVPNQVFVNMHDAANAASYYASGLY